MTSCVSSIMRTFAHTATAFFIVIGLAACGSTDAAESGKAPTDSGSSVTSPTEETLPVQGTPPAEATLPLLMTAAAVGPAVLGMSEDELVAALGETLTLSSDAQTFEEGFDVRPVIANGEPIFFVRFDDDRLESIVTTSPLVRTEEGLSPAMTIDDAVTLLGVADFSFYRFEGGRESVEFATAVPQFIRPSGADGVGTAGIYDFNITVEDPIGPFGATEHSPGSIIFSLTIEMV